MSLSANPTPHFLVCSCGSSEHVVQFIANDESDPGDDVLYINVQLRNYRRWYQRAWVALKYLFGYECRYGHWDCTSMSRDEAAKLLVYLKEVLRVP